MTPTKAMIADACAALRSVLARPGDDDEQLRAEEDENGVVHITRLDGSPVALMNRTTWDQLSATVLTRSEIE